LPFTHVALLSIDSLIAGCALAPLLPRASQRLAAAAMFGAADAAASTLGALVSPPLQGVLDPAAAFPALYAVYLAVAIGVAGAATARSRPWLIVAALAVALSLDNLVSPPATHAPAVLVGAASAAAVLLGLAAGARVLRGLPDGRRGAWLVAGVAASACVAVLG